MKYAWYIIGLMLALLPTAIFSLALSYWIRPSEEHTSIGNNLLQLGRTDAAVVELKEALRLNPSYLTHLNLGLALSAAQRWPEAMDEFRAAIALEPDTPGAYFLLANSLVRCGHPDEAISNYETVLRLDPGDNQTRLNLALICFQEGRNDQGRELIQKVVHDDPRNAQAHFYLGNALFELGRDSEAMNEFQTALQLSPGNRAVKANLAKARAATAAGAPSQPAAPPR